ncbi:MAG: recombinase family protein [Chloroflexi bacterium]|nr:recombinase family protein [Chloroflexota bacterium]
MKAAGYIRVSSEMQVKQGHSLDMQRKLITDYVHSKGWGLADLFCETARTGRLTDRPALKTMLARAKRGEFDVIVVTSFDRFHRNLLHLLIALDQLRQRNVSFVSVTENIDFTTPWGKVALAVLGSLAEIYSDKLSIETKRGKQGRVLKGLWNGSIPLGYCNGLCLTCTDVNGLNYCPHYGEPNRGDGKSLILHPIENIAVRLSFDWYETEQFNDGLIAEKLNGYIVTLPDGTTRHFRTKRLLSRGGPQPFTRDSVREMLMRVFYTGRVPYFGTTVRGAKLKRHDPSLLRPGTHPSLISMEVFERCQGIRRRLARKPRRVLRVQRAFFPLTGILFCGECGGHMIGGRCKGERRYSCNARIQHRVRCTQPSINADSTEATIIQVLSNLHWHDDWREQWHQVLESAWDRLPFLSDETQREKTREESLDKGEFAGAEEVSLHTPEQVARQRSYDIDELIETMQPLSAFRAHWEIATSHRDYKAQKQLLHTAFARIVVRGQAIDKIEATSGFVHLVRNTRVVGKASPGEKEMPLVAQILSQS